MHNIFAALRDVKDKRRVKLNKDFHADIFWWFNCALNFNHREIWVESVECHDITMFSGYRRIETGITGINSVIEWPCVYLYTDGHENNIAMFSSNDSVIGYSKDCEGWGMYLPEELCFDDVGMEICSVWLGVIENPQWQNCVIRVICARKSTYSCLRKLRSRSIMLSMIFKQIYCCLIERNIHLEVNYMPII